MTSLYTVQTLPRCASHHRSILLLSILLLNEWAYQIDIFLIAIEIISYLILIQQDHLAVYCKYFPQRALVTVLSTRSANHLHNEWAQYGAMLSVAATLPIADCRLVWSGWFLFGRVWSSSLLQVLKNWIEEEKKPCIWVTAVEACSKSTEILL